MMTDMWQNHYKSMVLGVVLLSAYVSTMPQTSSLGTQVFNEVRLVGGEAQHSGRLEVLMDGVWGHVCAAMFDDYDAKVACRQLGYHGDAFAYRDWRHGLVTGSQHLTQLDCSGDEQYLQDCTANTTVTRCTQGHASVRCFDKSGIVDEALESILARDCGRTVDARERYITNLAKIRDGTTINRFQTPWVAALYRASKVDSQFCGAAVLSEDYVLTAAHCLDGKWLVDIKVRVGEHSRDIDDSQHQDFEIEEAILHEHYSEVVTLDNDIALIRIKRSRGRGIRFSERVQPICLPKTGTSYQNHSGCTLTGWGRQHLFLDPIGDRLGATINILPISKCDEASPKQRHTSGMVCAAPAPGKLDNPCSGDSGSPLTCQVEPGTSTLMGLVSHGKPCLSSNEFPDKYTRVEKFLRWILNNIAKDWERRHLIPGI